MNNNEKNQIRIYNKAILKNALLLTGTSIVGVASVGGIVFGAMDGTLDMGMFSLGLAISLVSFGMAYTCCYNISEYSRFKQKIKKK